MTSIVADPPSASQAARAVVPRPHGPSLGAIATLALTLFAWAVHWHTFARPELGLDGALSVDLARSPLADLFDFQARDVHPPLFYVLLKGWLDLTGVHYLTAKYLAIAASLPALPLLYRLGRLTLPRWSAVAAVLLLAVAPAALFLAPTVRDFSLGLTLSLATALFTVLFAESAPRDKKRNAVATAMAILTAAALLTWYFHLFVLAAEALVVLWRRRGLSVAHLAMAFGVALSAPWYAFVLPRLDQKLASGVTTFGGAPHLPALPALLGAASGAVVGQAWGLPGGLALAGWLLAVLVGAGTLFSQRQGVSPHARSATALILVALLLGIAEVAVTTLRWSDVGSLGRYVLPLLPFIALLQARGLAAPRRAGRLATLLGLAPAVIAQVAWFHGLVTSPPIDWSHDPALAYVAAHSQPGDGVVFNDRARRGRYQLDAGRLPAWVIHSAGQRYLADSAGQANAVAADAVAGARRLWLVQTGPSTDYAQRALATAAFGAPPVNVQGSDVQLFLTAPPDRLVSPAAILGNLIQLRTARIPSRVAPGGYLALELDWTAVRPVAQSYTVFVHLKNAHGDTVAQHDSPPVFGFSPTNSWSTGQATPDRFAIPLPSALPPGRYAVHAGLYIGAQRLNLPDGSNLVDLGTVTVTP